MRQYTFPKACLVLACDGGTGSATIARMERALKWANQNPNGYLVVSACAQPGQDETDASQMAAWLKENGHKQVIELTASSYDTFGELEVFFENIQANRYFVCSDAWHVLPRAWLISLQKFRKFTRPVSLWRKTGWRDSWKEVPKLAVDLFPRRMAVQIKKWIARK